MFHNKELRISLIVLLFATGIMTLIGLYTSVEAGLAAFVTGILSLLVHLAAEFYRYRKLRNISSDLDALLTRGTPIPIHAYEEGELSILANQIQKITLRLKEAAETVASDKKYLADSLADISHQLRTPLTAMNLTTTMLRSPDLTDGQRMELTGELRRLLVRTDWLVETLLKLSKLDAGTVELGREPVRVRDLISRASAPLAIPMDLRNQQLIVNCQEERFCGDLTWTAEALGNILKNCTEHTPEGGRIMVIVEETALYTQITVEDSGRGFDSKDIPHLFERFYKGSNASETSYGIGLALARTVITAQNGTIQAMNGSSGARFVIKFYKQVI